MYGTVYPFRISIQVFITTKGYNNIMCACVVSIHVHSECEACIFICAINIIAGDREDSVTQLETSTFEPPAVDNSYIAGICDTRVYYCAL